jgi:hypothetical protein
MTKKVEIDSDWLREKYIEEELTQEQIADEVGVVQTTISEHLKKNNIPTGHEAVECPGCGKLYSSMGRHWARYSEHAPELTNEERDMLIGIVMSDGNVHSPENQNSRIILKTTNKQYLEYVDNKLGVLSMGVSKRISAKEKARKDRDSGWNEGALEENYSDMYGIGTRRCSMFNGFREWYSSGKKRWPMDDLKLTPVMFKHLFVGDGNKDGSDRISIGTLNELDRKDEIKAFFREAGFEVQAFHSGYFSFSQKTSYEIYEWMGEPLPGFKYKWPESFR